MRADFRVCLDACVLANQAVCDLLLRLAEHPRLYSPVFSEEILNEVYSVHLGKLKRPWPQDLADYWQEQVRESFEEAIHPQDYLITLFEMSPEVVVDRLHLIGRDRGITPSEVLTHLTKPLPLFAESVARELGWEI